MSARWSDVSAAYRGRVVEALMFEAARWERRADERPEHAKRYRAEAEAFRAAITKLEGA